MSNTGTSLDPKIVQKKIVDLVKNPINNPQESKIKKNDPITSLVTPKDKKMR
jgi:hypothetical protein